MPNAFRFSVEEGVRVDPDTFALVRECRKVGTHGIVRRVDFKAAHAAVTLSDGSVRQLSNGGGSRLHNLLLADLRGEAARRVQWRASHKVPAPNGDPRFAAPRPLDPDAAHHRRV